MIYGYARISTDKQNMERQIRNILAVNAQAKKFIRKCLQVQRQLEDVS